MRRPGYPSAVVERSAVRPLTAQPVTRTIPFDYVFQFELTGNPANRVQDVVDISMQGTFVAVSIGYSFVLDERSGRRQTFGPVLAQPPIFLREIGRTASSITLGEIAAGLAGIGVSPDRGFKINPNFARFLDADLDLGLIPTETLNQAFEPGCGPEDVSFFYTIDVPSTGRELQNKPIHNIAGLGIANGDRPFRPFAKPIAFEPRTSIRIQVEEISTLPGTLFMVLQGYKILGSARIPE
jgi:hypothetical protein